MNHFGVTQEEEVAKSRDAFLYHVLSMFGACAKVLSDQGTEFQGDFQELLEESFIDHRVTSKDLGHPEADDLAKRMVQTCKMTLRKYGLTRNCMTWDRMLPYLDNPEEWLRVIEQRAQFFKTVMPMAMNNLLIA